MGNDRRFLVLVGVAVAWVARAQSAGPTTRATGDTGVTGVGGTGAPTGGSGVGWPALPTGGTSAGPGGSGAPPTDTSPGTVFVPPIDSATPYGRDTGRACENLPDLLCVPWSREVQGACPALAGTGCSCTPVGASRGAYADGECCWTVDYWEAPLCGGCI